MPLFDELQAAQEMLAVPQRYVLGATKEDFVDADGNQVPTWEAYIGRFLALGNSRRRSASFPVLTCETSPRSESLRQARRVGDGSSGAGQTTENPASADAIRSSEAVW